MFGVRMWACVCAYVGVVGWWGKDGVDGLWGARRSSPRPQPTPHHQTPHPTNYPKPQQFTNRNKTTTANNNKPTEAVAEVGKAQEKLLNKRAMALQKRDASLKKIQARSL